MRPRRWPPGAIAARLGLDPAGADAGELRREVLTALVDRARSEGSDSADRP